MATEVCECVDVAGVRGGPSPPDPPLPITGEGGDFHAAARRYVSLCLCASV
ncbi:MAG: hypothetical protein AVDCRST_MAG68-16 [uncultured Gemmatimonadetes bacterium]|uniref:Uncharacterized protein n=1 Tax=uncultured Gemmatimonadota bacterium TaxID=203437 RepID=A0A6J4K5U0_9BACT|nr:MAG: hypothetical protein AVDCRST_MAG68-16 [uncultured Gemmatimonadota bacterium]